MLSFLTQFSIRARLLTLTCAAAAGLLVMALVGGWGLRTADSLLARFVNTDVKALEYLGHLQGAAANLRRNEKDLLINMGNPAKAKESLDDWEQARQRAHGTLEGLRGLGLSDGISDAAKAMQEHLQRYRDGFQQVADKALKGELVDAGEGNKAMKPYKPAVNAIEEGVPLMEGLLAKRQAQTLAEQREVARRLGWTLAGSSTLLLLLLFVLSNVISNSIVRPLQQAREVAERIAGRDLRGEVAAQGQDEAAYLLRAIAAMQSSISSVVNDVKSNTDSIATAAREVADGSQDLSQRTERSASDLQAAASAMDELTQSVQQASVSAHEAKRMADSASQVAHRGGAVVDQVVNTMGLINTSSKRIADIIGTIDGIAFQTNILALNAAVEAARAGEQGRGFAVVASEVRSLAQRSAAAAKEIKLLISQSGENVGTGVELVQQAGQTMQEIVSAIGHVSSRVAEISHATDEQHTGITQVAQTVTRLDEMTQQNAALVEESAAAASSLQGQADELARAVAVFRT